MTTIPSHPDIEGWLSAHARSFRLLTVAEYRDLARTWKAAFEPLFIERRVRWAARAEIGIRAYLPCTGYVFSLPGYPHQPSTHERGSPLFAYHVDHLTEIDLRVAHDLDAIIADERMSFTFLGTHEHDSMGQPALMINRSAKAE